jgi:hypothetical protein
MKHRTAALGLLLLTPVIVSVSACVYGNLPSSTLADSARLSSSALAATNRQTGGPSQLNATFTLFSPLRVDRVAGAPTQFADQFEI